MINCTDFTADQYPQIHKGMRVRLFNGTEGEINNIELDKYFFFYGDSTKYHTMDIKYIF